ncbi:MULTISPECIES: hypothetical protein [unclassified Mesorhizobium]|uniref:hypothetical protein n=1 Tax=unclassified Mesorhizobium TaxID=325217 RepID=UPI000FCACE67|nr:MULTISPECIES: hypothetical protein [unclassified Mesorhizobium]RVC61540.1 hypothetical protein EN779_10295 [Mesorhizobium sp. M4B.F.Ca.ET.088.02.2.1]RUW72571.1 hypothetical protein EOA31_15075 [Mesorhizobium sp. M4B.F.Ca.ET.049.02.1.2]RVD19560.1 hypothetical protein EN738_25720 [Mesorhizobium sp. M4B.F.Ca.ET.017.02.2.1]RWA60275.1 MAG: hypothetical protein EOQ27_23200 [Mesorhizobium sp.]RWC92574.1 MAG: hypothetical protein EOS32_25770 [Mesorhizobium sp.]
MAEISTTTPITIRRLSLPRPDFPRLAIGALLAAMSNLVGDALNMAYVAPYSSRVGRPRAVPDNDLEGRDPNW